MFSLKHVNNVVVCCSCCCFLLTRRLLLDIYERMLWQPWRMLWLPFKFLEAARIAVLAAPGRGHETRKILVQLDGQGHGGPGARGGARRRFKALEDTSGAPGSQEQKNFILKGLLENVVKFLFKYEKLAEKLLEFYIDSRDGGCISV